MNDNEVAALLLQVQANGSSSPLGHVVLVALAYLAVSALIRSWRRWSSRDSVDTPAAQPAPPDAAAPKGAWRGDPRGPEAALALLARAEVPELLAVTPLESVVQLLSTILAGEAQSFVLFRHGTFVLVDAAPELAPELALARLATFGPVAAGGSAGDFSVWSVTGDRGRLVTSHESTIMTFVSPAELAGSTRSDLEIGLIGRAKRHVDAHESQIVHVAALGPGQSPQPGSQT